MFDELLDAHTLQKGLRICGWIQRFIRNSATPASDRKTGLLDTSEIDQQRDWWVKRAQKMCQTKDEFQEDKLQLNLQPNGQGILECRGRIQGECSIYLPDSHPFTYKLVQQAHLTTMHGGSPLTMAKVREAYWVPRLRRLVKRV